MRVEILGTRGNISARAPGHALHSGVLIDGRILLDVGEPTFLRRRPRSIFISHLHPDHAAVRESDVMPGTRVFLPERTAAFPTATVAADVIRLGPYRVTAIPTRHSVHCRSVGFVVQRAGRRVFYTSDLFGILRRYHARLNGLDLVLTDGSFFRRGGLVKRDPVSGRQYGHAGIPDLVGLFRRFARRIVIMHFGSWFYRDPARAVARIVELSDDRVRVSAAHDGMVIRL